MTFILSLLNRFLLATGLLAGGLAQAQAVPASPPASRPSNLGWQACQVIKNDGPAQLACFQKWADSQLPPNATLTTAPANLETGQPETAILMLPALNNDAPDGKPIGCRNPQYSELSRFWELQRGTDCDTFAIRGYRPISVAFVMSGGVSSPPVSGVAVPPIYRHAETKIQLSVRTKIAKGLLKRGDADAEDQDSLWFGYTQQSYWQLFTSKLSRPFRSTDHEPELIYIYPHQIALPGGWDYRLSGVGLVHQSNGQSDPLSRSWNRIYLMGAAEKVLGPESSLRLQARLWNRVQESSGTDNNPGIENYIGRAELNGAWQINKANTLGVTLRHSMNRETRGSTRIDWMRAPTASPNYTGLRYHVQLFSGYGDSLLDYDKRRNVLSVGLSLVDW
ncbi:MAG: phospholipase [Polaromonas sp.]|nr:phospholipase [Polaromonas sp.]